MANLWCYIVVDGIAGERHQVINEGARGEVMIVGGNVVRTLIV